MAERGVVILGGQRLELLLGLFHCRMTFCETLRSLFLEMYGQSSHGLGEGVLADELPFHRCSE